MMYSVIDAKLLRIVLRTILVSLMNDMATSFAQHELTQAFIRYGREAIRVQHVASTKIGKL